MDIRPRRTVRAAPGAAPGGSWGKEELDRRPTAACCDGESMLAVRFRLRIAGAWRRRLHDPEPRPPDGGRLVARAASPAVRTRPEPSVWSALEYACHVRDALLVQRERVLLAQVEERPSFAPMYRVPAGVLCRLPRRTAGGRGRPPRCGRGVGGPRPGRPYGAAAGPGVHLHYAVATERDVAWLGRHSAHEAWHHLGHVKSWSSPVSAADTLMN